MSENRAESVLTRADALEWLDLEPLPGARPMLPRSQRIVAVLKLPCRAPGCSRRVAYSTQRLCRLHYNRLKWRFDAPNGHATDGRGRDWREHIGYTAAHFRAHERHGRAADFHCELCPARAVDWALPPSLATETCAKSGRRYSLDPEDYMPLCRSCHRTLDGRNPPLPGVVPLPLEGLRPVIRREPWGGESR